jgi:hypothetical protein
MRSPDADLKCHVLNYKRLSCYDVADISENLGRRPGKQVKNKQSSRRHPPGRAEGYILRIRGNGVSGSGVCSRDSFKF